ncbi:MBL fold metallo-hydrolase [Gordonia jacobaea]|uniref:MBL fold metallo-hydrolase n=1 Tax=Gordonia jacobaea TaxID=122202 RepID=UPI003D7512EE
MSTPLTLHVFTGQYKPIPYGEVPSWDPAQQATWPATTATLIAGHEHAVLVDALLTRSEGEQLARWVTDSTDAALSHIYITHGHADHFFGAGALLRQFPYARLVSRPETLHEAQQQVEPAMMAAWTAWFDGQFDTAPTVPVEVSADHLDVDGHLLRVLPIGGADGVTATIVHIPDLDAIVSGDIAYNDIHMWLVGSTPHSRREWLSSLDRLEAYAPKTIIAGHRDPAAPDDDARRLLDQSRQYISDFDRLAASADTAGAIVEAMLATYGHFGNPYTLHAAADSQFASPRRDGS